MVILVAAALIFVAYTIYACAREDGKSICADSVPPAIKARLRTQCRALFKNSGGTVAQADEFFETTLRVAVQKVGNGNIWNASKYLARADENPQIAEDLAWKRSTGVRDGDIAWWWNMHAVERQFLLDVHNFHKMTMFTYLLEEGQEAAVAAEHVKHAHPLYCLHLKDEMDRQSPDADLPIELKDRIDAWIMNEVSLDPTGAQYRSKLAGFRTFNAFVREALAAGTI